LVSNVTAIYNLEVKQVVAIIVDATNIDEHDWPGCIKAPIDPSLYDGDASQEDKLSQIASIAASVVAEIQ
jgi:hypothetical protein